MTIRKVSIKDRWSEAELYAGEVEAPDDATALRLVLEIAVKNRASLDGASLDGANLDGARLVGARLDRAHLVGANLVGANLDRARLDRARLDRANLDRANLVGARLVGARLVGANLDGARLVGARLDEKTILPTKETWKQYLEEVLPALLRAGGKTLEEVAAAWECHSWENCPMAVAFSVTKLEGVPTLLRPRAEQFVQLFDAKLIPCPVKGKASGPEPKKRKRGKKS